jgi:uncharacterized protein YecE (DUF72 family)
MKWYIGTSGWSYPSWKNLFYPKEIPQREWLAYYARHFDAVEINNTFYRAPAAAQIHKWEEAICGDFTFAIKASRLVTHLKRLKDPAETIPELMKPLEIRKRKGPIIFQLPPGLSKDTELLKNFLKALPKRQRFAMEFRNPSWHSDEVYELLRQYHVAFCMFEKAELRSPRVMTADFAYVRLHGRESGYKGNYSVAALQDWHGWLKAQKSDAYVFFDNTAEKTDALDNAKTLSELAEKP